jgi:signal transduction histidine kinase
MRLSLQGRVLAAVFICLPIGFVAMLIGGHLVFDLLQYWRGGATTCDSGALRLVDAFNGCYSNFNPFLGGFELLAIVGALGLIGWALARWITWPLRAMRSSVEQLGPNSLGVRISATGPNEATKQLADAIDAMLDRVAEGYDAQRRFAANASHELRTPLATQRALIEVSLSHALTPDQLQLLTRQLLATNERNEKLIDGLLTLAETEQGLRVDTPQRLDLIAAATMETLRPSAQERGVSISGRLDPADVAGEQPLLERLSSNLVQNAIKYNVPGGWVHVSVQGDGVLSVANSGPTVAPDVVPSLFEPFRRASGDRLEHGGGVGLGLTIARSIVAAHGGSIAASANPDGGLTVEARLRPAN